MIGISLNVNMKKIVAAAVAAVVLICVFAPEASFAAVKKYTQKGYALAKYATKDYKPVKNKKIKKINVENKDCYHYVVYGFPAAYMPHLMLSRSASTKNMDMMTMFKLPKTWEGYDLGNPQSMSITPDGKTAYVTHVFNSKKETGRIFKYDLEKMRELRLNVPGMMDGLRNYDRYEENYRQMGECITIGPEFYMGHGSIFGYNPKDKHLWMVTKKAYSSKKKMDDMHFWRINMDTLKPDTKVTFKMYNIKAVTMGNNITFDKNGYCYFFSHAGSKQGKCPKGAIKIYRGKINLKAKKKVSFKLMMNVICNPVVANGRVQSAGYDHKNNRIYMVCNSALLSVPADKLGKNKVKPADVWMTQFVVPREFQGFEVDKNGVWYLLANKDPEILTQIDLEPWRLSKSDFNSKGEYKKDSYTPPNDPTQGGDEQQ